MTKEEIQLIENDIASLQKHARLPNLTPAMSALLKQAALTLETILKKLLNLGKDTKTT